MTDDEWETKRISEGFGDAEVRTYEPNDRPELHTHEFTATGIITSGELRMVYEDEEEVLRAGDSWTIPAGTVHSEQPGPEGATGLLARRS